MAGPWFTVQESGEEWKQVESIWVSNGERHAEVRVEIRVQLQERE